MLETVIGILFIMFFVHFMLIVILV